jgi:hypothetical protein
MPLLDGCLFGRLDLAAALDEGAGTRMVPYPESTTTEL